MFNDLRRGHRHDLLRRNLHLRGRHRRDRHQAQRRARRQRAFILNHHFFLFLRARRRRRFRPFDDNARLAVFKAFGVALRLIRNGAIHHFYLIIAGTIKQIAIRVKPCRIALRIRNLRINPRFPAIRINDIKINIFLRQGLIELHGDAVALRNAIRRKAGNQQPLAASEAAAGAIHHDFQTFDDEIINAGHGNSHRQRLRAEQFVRRAINAPDFVF